MPPEQRSVTVDLGWVRGLVAGFSLHFCAVHVLEAEPRLKVFPNQGAWTRGCLLQAWGLVPPRPREGRASSSLCSGRRSAFFRVTLC